MAMNTAVTRLADPVHKSQCQFRQGLKAQLAILCFPIKRYLKNLSFKKNLCMDIKERCHAILQNLHTFYNGNFEKLSAKIVSTVVDRCVDCYAGKCGDRCRWSHILCRRAKKTSWCAKSALLSSYWLKSGSLSVLDHDRFVFIDILELKLDMKSPRETKLNTSTQKCEAVNKAVSASLPKNKTYSRNAKSRACAAILRSTLMLA